ncbi:MAG: Ig-like domain-containing protein [Candidatus Cryptobacteroides sp.]
MSCIKNIIITAAICVTAAIAASCSDNEEVSISAIHLDCTDLTLTIGDTYQIVAMTEPDNVPEGAYVCMSNNYAVASVTEDGLVTALTEGSATITVSALKGGAYENCRVTVKTPGFNLSEEETANCYIVNEPGLYKFKPAMGNSTQVIVPASVEVLWETLGTSTAPEAGALVRDVRYENGLVYFSTPDEFVPGNAVIAARNESGKILWSWHIWLVDEIGEIVYANNAGILMDRNLGATSAKPGDVGALGLVYQWGRKDPFPGASSIKQNGSRAATTPEAPDREIMTPATGNIEYTVMNPRVFLSYDKKVSGVANDWYCNESAGTTDATRWMDTKTMYDPCPPGWKVPRATSAGLWKTAGIPHAVATPGVDSENCGIMLGEPYCTPDTWYPCAGHTANGKLNSGNEGHYWSFSTTDMGGKAFSAGLFRFMLTDRIFSADNAYKYLGKSVRCQKVE